MLEPTHSRPAVEGPRSGNKRAAIGGIARYSSTPKICIHAIEQKRLIVVDLNIRTETSSFRRLASRYVKNTSLIGVVLDERLSARDHHRTSARRQKCDVFKHYRKSMVAYEHAGIVRRIAIKNCTGKVDRLSRSSDRDRGQDVILTQRNDDLAGLGDAGGVCGNISRRDGSFMNAAGSATDGVATKMRLCSGEFEGSATPVVFATPSADPYSLRRSPI